MAAWANGFAGTSAAWFDRRTIFGFAQAITAYPLPEEPIEISGGFGAKDGAPPQEHVGVRVSRAGVRGQVGIRTHLSTEVWPNTRPESVHRVRLELMTTYERVRFLGRHLTLLVEGRLAVAEIEGDRLV